MGLFLAVLGFLVGTLVGWRFVRRSPKPRFLLHLEYWVYLPGEILPPQDEVMTRLVRPEEGRPAIGTSEALLFSDVRLHIALVLRNKNRHVFRPDILEPHVDATPEQLAILDGAKSMAKVRFLSETPVGDRRYLGFLPQVARAIAEIGEGRLVYDAMGERLLDPASLRAGDPGASVRWVPEAMGGYVRTDGLRKVGVPEIRTAPVSADERWLVGEVVEQVVGTIWKAGALPTEAFAEAFDDRFRVTFALDHDGEATARVHRIQGV